MEEEIMCALRADLEALVIRLKAIRNAGWCEPSLISSGLQTLPQDLRTVSRDIERLAVEVSAAQMAVAAQARSVSCR